MQRALKSLGQLDQAFDNQVAKLGQGILALLLQLLRRALQQHH